MDGEMMDYELKADAIDAAFDAMAVEADSATDGRIEAMAAEIDGLKRQIERQQLASGRPALAGGVKSDDGTRARFVDGYLRQGVAGTELKSLVGTTTTDGGFAVPREIDAMIGATLRSISPIRAIANVVSIGTSGYRKLVTTGGSPSGWAAEDAARPMTDTPKFNEIAPPMGDLYANPAASQAMLDDVAFDVESWLADEIAREFARAEGAAFINGNGTNRPKGFLTYAATNQNDTARAFGTLQYLATGTAGGFGTAGADKLVDLVQSLRAPYRQGATFVMNAATAAAIRKFKTADGAFLWQPGLVNGAPDTLLGYPVVEAEDMPDIATDAMAIAFGNFKAGYLVAERRETSILRDPFSNKPFVHFYASKRIGGAVMNSEAIKLLKFGVN